MLASALPLGHTGPQVQWYGVAATATKLHPTVSGPEVDDLPG